MTASRRAVLAGAVGVAGALSACADDGAGRVAPVDTDDTDDAAAPDTGATSGAEADDTPQPEPVRDADSRLGYGDDPSQWVDLYRPDGASRGVVVVIHGGFWKAAYGADLGAPLAADLAARGWTAANVEYRRVGNGGGTPQTFRDIAAAIDALADVDGLDLTTVVTLGHSAGGHLAVWAAGRRDPGVAVTHAVSQAGVLDLVLADRMSLGGGAVQSLLGHPPGPRDARWDPQQQIPLDVPVWCVHGIDDAIVPLGQSEGYVVDATAAGAQAEIVRVEGDHFVVIDVASPAWQAQLRILDAIA